MAWCANCTIPSTSMDDQKLDGARLTIECEGRRAFGLRSLEREGPHYFVELADGRVLYVRGQFLCAYEPEVEGAQTVRARTFPNTDFVLVLDASRGEARDVICRGAAFEPEHMFPPSRELAWGHPWLSGEIIKGLDYEGLVARYCGG